MRLCLSLLSLFAFAVAATPNDNWPAFRGPTADGISDSKGVATTWSEKENVRWKTAIHGKGWSSPVVWGDQVWVTTADEIGGTKGGDSTKTAGRDNPVQKVTFFALCIDRKTGTIAKDITLASEDKPAFCHPFNSYASPTSAIEPGRIYAHFGSHGTWCVDTKTGEKVWERRDLKCNHFRGPASSPVIFEDKIILIFDGSDQQYVVALNKANGDTVWKMDRNIKYPGLRPNDDGDTKKAYATAAVLDVNGKKQLVCPSAECTMAYDPKDGAELWRLTHGGMNGSARAVFGHGLMYLNTGHSSKLLAVKQGVAGAVPKDAIAWESNKNVPSRSSVLLVGDLLFMVNDGGMASCVDAKTGKPHWNERLDGEFSASPVFADGNVYFCNQIGKTFVVAAKDKYEPVAENRLDAGFMASPAVVGDTLFLRTRTHLYAIGGK
ncbi:MAG TPA: PQQ-binding-like beta-propeller repeat protein [Gemmataceae bacterium]|nr:PQQ-binding-like beta-propeller repeat protein [Gemmataceae bacterium]